MDQIHVCFAIYDKSGQYSKYLGVAILSLLKNTANKVYIHIVSDGSLTDSNISKFEHLVLRYGQHISFYTINSGRLESFRGQVKTYTIGTLFRFFLLDVLPNDIERIIYLDDDILVNVDIKELWHIDLKGNLIAACHDQGLGELSIGPAPCVEGKVLLCDYFNAGVMIMDLKSIRCNENFSEMCIKMLNANPNYIFVDQDIFNVVKTVNNLSQMLFKILF